MTIPEWVRYRKQLVAETRLVQIDNCEKFAQLHDQETFARFRIRYAEQYRRIVGVHPDRRREFVERLRPIAQSGDAKIADGIVAF